jgi:hypothetical protein
MLEIWRHRDGTGQHAASNNNALTFQDWVFEFHWGDLHPSSSKGHRFVLVVTDYFTKWTDAVPLRNMTHKEVMNFV